MACITVGMSMIETAWQQSAAVFLRPSYNPADRRHAKRRHSSRYTVMRLLDLIAQGRGAVIHAGNGQELPGAHRFGAQIRECPLRYVLSDELARCATQLAYAEGDRLSSCMDLIRAPARSLWVEWAEGPRREALEAIPALEVKTCETTGRGGALLTASADCRSGSMRTFWSAADERAYLSPVITSFNLDRPPELSISRDPSTWRGEAVLQLEGEPAIEELLAHLRFHFDEEWATYYHERIHTAELRAQVLRTNLNGCAFDGPMLMAFFLLLGSRNLLPRQEVRHERLNRARMRDGKPPLLEHVEVSAPLDTPPTRAPGHSDSSFRSSPRIHHVRGHIVRRGAAVFWRSPHLRGSARLGQVRSRTVTLTFGQSASAMAYH
jgi:hypothetical protein